MTDSPAAYGLWGLVLINSFVFILFAYSFFKPQTTRDWRSFSAFSAFLVALFAEMYGFPLTIYFLSGWLQSHYPNVDWFSHDAGHLLEMMFGWKTNPHAGPFHILSFVFITTGFFLISAAWRILYQAQQHNGLATAGPYSYVRHPQYVGFILVMFGFLLQWPTLLTLAMFPVLVVMYVKLARNEEREALASFGDDYRRYMVDVPGFTRVADDCIEDCFDPSKPPVIIVDPRAGHGPGIGGFKRASEVGIALHEGYPVYFVVFFPEPCPGQTIADVLHALRRFVEKVAGRHSGSPPILYGNCQAGWAITLLAADCEGLAGPIVLNGSPLSYWAGDSGANPMRISGGLFGGAWPAHLIADLGNGRFDGAWLVQNFEGLRPEAVWEKYTNLFSHVDSERERFLGFERWWGSYYFLSREEILAIIGNLFVGNRLEQGTLRICDGCFADLRRIHNPIVIFASSGDNITPPHQAMGWIPVVYKDTDDLKRAGQRIVYLLNSHVGHLGIFVSASVAKLEHRAILDSLSDVAALPPGLYEMKIDNPTGDPDCRKGAYKVRFEERQVEDIRSPVDRPAFERVRKLSEQLDSLYVTTLSKWVQSTTNPYAATLLEWLHPMRVSRHMFGSSFTPAMPVIASLASTIRNDRHAVPDDAPLKKAEATMFDAVREALTQVRLTRDDALEQVFDRVYGSGGAPADCHSVNTNKNLG